MSGLNQHLSGVNSDLNGSDGGSNLFSPASNDIDTTPSSSIIPSLASSIWKQSTNTISTQVVYPPGIQKVRNICCVGAGYVGGPTASVIAFQNPDICVTIVDKDAKRIRKWASRHLPIHEPGLSDIVRVARDGTDAVTQLAGFGLAGVKLKLPARLPNLFFSTEVAKCISEAEVIFISVNTDTKLSGVGAGAATNMSALEDATQDIALAARPGAIIVEKSTVPCRTAQVVRDILKIHRPNVDFEILSNPEFLAEGTAIRDLLYPDRIIIGSAQTSCGLAAAEALKAVYGAWVPLERIVTVNLWSSELSKLAANSMLAQRISSINTISAICERTGADIDEVAHSIGLDARLGPKFLKASLGFGGSCFKKDILSLVYLAQCLELPEVAEYWMQVLSINEFQRDRFVKRVVKNLNGTLIGKKIIILGYAFKKDTSDARESPAVEVVKSLLADSPAEVAIFDPKCNPEDIKDELKRLFKDVRSDVLKPEGPIEVYKSAYEACSDASAVLILTDWDQFRYPKRKTAESVFKKDSSTRANSISMVRRDSVSSLSSASFYHHRADFGRKISEFDILDFHDYLKDEYHEILTEDTRAAKDVNPLGGFVEQPACEVDCRECLRGEDEETMALQDIDWRVISESVRKPKWVFDGRDIVDVIEMEKLGFRVEVIGKAGSRSRLNGFDD